MAPEYLLKSSGVNFLSFSTLPAAPAHAAMVMAVLADRVSLPVDLPPRAADGIQEERVTLTLRAAGLLVVDRAALRDPAWVEVRDGRGNLVSALADFARVSTASARRASTHTSRYDLPAGTYTIRALGASGTGAEAEVALLAGESRRVQLTAR